MILRWVMYVFLCESKDMQSMCCRVLYIQLCFDLSLLLLVEQSSRQLFWNKWHREQVAGSERLPEEPMQIMQMFWVCNICLA